MTTSGDNMLNVLHRLHHDSTIAGIINVLTCRLVSSDWKRETDRYLFANVRLKLTIFRTAMKFSPKSAVSIKHVLLYTCQPNKKPLTTYTCSKCGTEKPTLGEFKCCRLKKRNLAKARSKILNVVVLPVSISLVVLLAIIKVPVGRLRLSSI